MKRFALYAIGITLLLTGTHAARATTVIARDFDQLVARAETIFKGTVTATESRWVGEGETRHISTRVTFRVEETYKGDAAATQTLEISGGTVGDTRLHIDDVPTFEVGQNDVLFVVGNGKQFCPLVGICQGRFHVVKDLAAGNERIYNDDLIPVVDTAELGKFDADGKLLMLRHKATTEKAVTTADFKAQIQAKVAALPR